MAVDARLNAPLANQIDKLLNLVIVLVVGVVTRNILALGSFLVARSWRLAGVETDIDGGLDAVDVDVALLALNLGWKLGVGNL